MFIHSPKNQAAMLPILLLLSGFLPLSTAADFCVADLSQPDTPAGYPCKQESAVYSSDFVFRDLGADGDSFPLFEVFANFVVVERFAALNGLGVSLLRLTIGAAGSVPIHTHPSASEVLTVVKGNIFAGFISSANALYTAKIGEGDMMVFPRGLAHFQVNIGFGEAVAIVSFNADNPGLQILDYALFGSKIPTPFLHKISLIDVEEIEKLKQVFQNQTI